MVDAMYGLGHHDGAGAVTVSVTVAVVEKVVVIKTVVGLHGASGTSLSHYQHPLLCSHRSHRSYRWLCITHSFDLHQVLGGIQKWVLTC